MTSDDGAHADDGGVTRSIAPHASDRPWTQQRPPRIVVLGGGFGGVRAARSLEDRLGSSVEVTLVSQENFFLMTPLLFEACCGSIELRHCSVPIRAFVKRAHFVEATVERIDLRRRVVISQVGGNRREFPYDQLVLALGAWTNEDLIPGSEHALTFKTLADAVGLRNHLIERLERAGSEPDPEVKRRLLTFVVVGGGLVGTELLGEMTAFTDRVIRLYSNLERGDVRFFLIEHADEIMPEVDPALARYARAELEERAGVVIRTSTNVTRIEPNAVELGAERIAAETIVLAAGTVPSPVVASLELERDRAGRVMTDATLRSSRPEVWALGDCAAIPSPSGHRYPHLAQHALREGKHLARNIELTLRGAPPKPFVYRKLGMMASLGHRRAAARIFGVKLRGFFAWWLRRTYYLLQMPGFERKLRIVVDWTLGLFLRPDIVKIDNLGERVDRARLTAPARRAAPPVPLARAK